MQKQSYEELQAEVLSFEAVDVITTSSPDNTEGKQH